MGEEVDTQTSRKQIANGTPKFQYINFYIKCEKINMLNISKSVSLDQKSKTQLYAIIRNTL